MSRNWIFSSRRFPDTISIYGELEMMLTKVVGGRYYIVENLGDGGFSKTYIAKDKNLPNEPYCVVKQLKPQSTDPFNLQTARRLFAKEATVLQKLGKHDQIPQLLAYIEQDGDFYLVEELIEGNNLSQELRGGKKLSESNVIALLQDILQILKFIQQNNVIHRDLKPSNLILRKSDNKVVLIDFGAVKEITNVTSIYNDGENKSFTVSIGTPGYTPMEQSYGQPNLSSDIYAAGAIAIQALTGIQPLLLPRDDNNELVWCQQAEVSTQLKNILNKMVRYHSNQRYQSANEVLEDLKELTIFTPALSWTQQNIKEKKSIDLLEEELDSRQSENSRQRKQKNLLAMEEKIDSKQSENSRQRKQKNLLAMEKELDSKQTKNKQVEKKGKPVVKFNFFKKLFLRKLEVKI